MGIGDILLVVNIAFTCITFYQGTEIVLKANVPSLHCPPAVDADCIVYLVDNPGLGELNQLVERIAEFAVATSTAYIYTMDYRNVEWKEHAEVLRALLEKDNGNRIFLLLSKS